MTDNNMVTLTFEKSLTYLAGFDFGEKIYKDQLADKIDFKKNFTIIFPDQIKGVASSFVQGLFKEVIDEEGLWETEKKISIKSSSDELSEAIRKKLQ